MTFEEFAPVRLGALLRFAAALTGDRALAEDVPRPVWPSSGPVPPASASSPRPATPSASSPVPALPHPDDGPRVPLVTGAEGNRPG